MAMNVDVISELFYERERLFEEVLAICKTEQGNYVQQASVIRQVLNVAAEAIGDINQNLISNVI